VQPDAEHQQHHANVGELTRKFNVSNETWRCGTDQHAGN
jgi:hypothetical protein